MMIMNLTKRQLDILEASLEIINEGGIQSLTIKNIAKKVGISEPAIYRHFESKTKILLNILDYFIVNNKRMIQQNLSKNNSIKEVIGNLFDNFINTFIQYPNLISVIFSEEIFRNDPVFKEKSNQIFKENYFLINNIIKKGQQTGEIDASLNPDTVVTIIMGSIRLCIKRWQMLNFQFDLKESGQQLKETILKILLK